MSSLPLYKEVLNALNGNETGGAYRALGFSSVNFVKESKMARIKRNQARHELLTRALQVLKRAAPTRSTKGWLVTKEPVKVLQVLSKELGLTVGQAARLFQQLRDLDLL